jgi:hypothetical protein
MTRAKVVKSQCTLHRHNFDGHHLTHTLPPPPHHTTSPLPFSFVPETILKARKRRDDLRVAVAAARKEEKGAAKVRRAGELKRAESYLKGEWIKGG